MRAMLVPGASGAVWWSEGEEEEERAVDLASSRSGRDAVLTIPPLKLY